MNDIEILQEILAPRARVSLQQEGTRASVELTDTQSNTNVKITGVPHNSIVIRADAFEFKSPVFAGSKNERRRADFVIVSNEDPTKWIVCIEIKKGNIRKSEVIPQLQGARCVVDYCTSVGREFWGTKGFLQGYEYRFVGIANLNIPNPLTRSSTLDIQSQGALHNRPDVFLSILGRSDLSFRHLIDVVP